MALDLSQHPCFSPAAAQHAARVHLPVAAKCNIGCRYCNRQHDCINESRPGVSSTLLTPHQSLYYLERLVAETPQIRVVGIAGPGEAFATPEDSLLTLRLVRQHYPDMLLCVASNGLALAPHVAALAELQVSHVTITVNAVDPGVGARIYAWARPGKHVLRGEAAARELYERQMEALSACVGAGILVKVNTVVVPGINDRHAVEVARTVAGLGASYHNCIPLYPAPGSEFAELPSPAPADMAAIRREAGAFLPQMRHCGRCRADAAGLLGESMPERVLGLLREAAGSPPVPLARRPCVAVASHEGLLVNQHLGEADRFWVFGQDGNPLALAGVRPAPAAGGGHQRWLDLAAQLQDCRAILVSGAGPTPREVLAQQGLQVIVTEGLVEEQLLALHLGQPIRRKCEPAACGAGCRGSGTGCG